MENMRKSSKFLTSAIKTKDTCMDLSHTVGNNWWCQESGDSSQCGYPHSRTVKHKVKMKFLYDIVLVLTCAVTSLSNKHLLHKLKNQIGTRNTFYNICLFVRNNAITISLTSYEAQLDE